LKEKPIPLYIRGLQGHSKGVPIELKYRSKVTLRKDEVNYLYHATMQKKLRSILEK